MGGVRRKKKKKKFSFNYQQYSQSHILFYFFYLGEIQDQAGLSSKKPNLAVDVPIHCRRV